jgi:hypothetical protein
MLKEGLSESNSSAAHSLRPIHVILPSSKVGVVGLDR